jgi:hypothetical protein
MASASRCAALALVCLALLVTSAPPAWADGSSMDPFGQPSWFEIILGWLHGDQGSIIDPNG